MLLKRKALWITVAVVAVLLGSLGGGYALAKTSLNPVSANGTISAAYQKNNGQLRLVNGASDVLPSEKFIQWNQTGPQGEPGVGIAGVVNNGNGTFTLDFTNNTSFTTPDLTGPQGETGAAGVGIAGVVNNGDGTYTLDFTNNTSYTTANLTGPQGPQGKTGAAGVGITGAVNNGNGTFTLKFTDGTSFTTANLTGPQGTAGIGITGAVNNGNGTFTLKFTDGNSFTTANLTGSQGPAGANGTSILWLGSFAAAPANPSLDNAYYNSSDNTSYVYNGKKWDVLARDGAPGPQGPAGTAGTAVLNGTTVPNLGTGTTGDFYIDTATDTLYGPKTGSGWGTGTSLVGPQGPAGSTSSMTPLQIATLQWYNAGQNAFGVGPKPVAVCFDGSHIWTADHNGNNDGSNVNELDASTGQVLGVYPVSGTDPTGICYDGAFIWVTTAQGYVDKVYAGNGNVVGGFKSTLEPTAICYDGSHVWVTLNNPTTGVDGKVEEILDSSVLAQRNMIASVFPVGVDPAAICFDGTHIWVANKGLGVNDGTVTELNASNGDLVHTYVVGHVPAGICYDGSHIWVANYGDDSVTEIDPAAEQTVHTYSLSSVDAGGQPTGICYDGSHIWVAVSGDVNNENTGYVTELDAATGTIMGTYPAGLTPSAVCFDGADIWVTNYGDNTVTKY